MSFARPWVLIFIPALIALLAIGRRKKLPLSSLVLFDVFPDSFTQKICVKLISGLALGLMVLGIMLGIVALAEPLASEVIVTTQEIAARINVIINDVSGSMSMATGDITRMDMLKTANIEFINEFCGQKENTTGFVGLVIFDTEATVKLLPTSDCLAAKRVVKTLKPGGGTNIELGLWAGFERLIRAADTEGRYISENDLAKIYASTKERKPFFPEKRREFCEAFRGLSFNLFTDGDFPGWALSRESALQATALRSGGQGGDATGTGINPFSVLDIAHSLCIRTYFSSVEEIPPAYQAAFTAKDSEGHPLGEVKLVKNLSTGRLSSIYREIAKKERGRLTTKKEIRYNPLKSYFLGAGLASFILGAMLSRFNSLGKIYGQEE